MHAGTVLWFGNYRRQCGGSDGLGAATQVKQGEGLGGPAPAEARDAVLSDSAAAVLSDSAAAASD